MTFSRAQQQRLSCGVEHCWAWGPTAEEHGNLSTVLSNTLLLGFIENTGMKLLPKANGKGEPWKCLQHGSEFPDTRYFQRSQNLAKREVCFYSHSAGTEPCDLSSYKAEKENTKQSNLFFFSAKGGKNDGFNDFSHPSRSSKTLLRSHAERMNYRWSFAQMDSDVKSPALLSQEPRRRGPRDCNTPILRGKLRPRSVQGGIAKRQREDNHAEGSWLLLSPH